MSISFSCEKCGKLFEVGEEMVGKKCRCKQCGHVFPIPAARGAGPSSPSGVRPAAPPPLPKDDLFAVVPPPPRRSVPEAELEDDEPRARPGRPKAPGTPSKKSGGGGLVVPLIVVGALGGLFLMVVIGAALLIPAVKAARQAADRARAKAEGRVLSGRRGNARAPRPVALNNTPAPVPTPTLTPPVADDPLVNDDYRTNEQFIRNILDKMTQMADLLATIRDQRSAQRVESQVKALATDLMQSETRAQALPPLTEEQDNQLSKKYDPLVQAAKERVDRELARVTSIAGTPSFSNQRVTRIGPRMGRPPLSTSRGASRFGPRGPNIGTRPGLPAPAPVPMDPNTTITVVVEGINDKEAADVIREKVSALMKGLGSKSWRYTSKISNGVLAFTISGVSDPQVFADHVNFGQVSRVEGRSVYVTPSILPGELRPPDSDFIAQALYDLKSPNLQNRKQALSRLARSPVDQARRAEVAQAIVPMLQDLDGFARADAAKALAVWGGPESVPALIAALKDSAFNVRWAVLDALKGLKDPQASEALAAMLTERQDRGKAIEALKAIGPPAEEAVIPLLSHGDDHVRSEACKILQVIGSEKSVPMLMRLAMNKVGFSDGAAREALNAMRLRGVNLNVANKKKRR